MPRIDAQMAQGWAERYKLPVEQLDEDLLDAVETEVLALIAAAYDTTTWVDVSTTPRIVQVVISKMYVSWLYKRSFAEDQDQGNRYAYELQNNANMLIEGLRDGTIDIPGVTPVISAGEPSFYPTDASSSQESTYYDPSLGPAQFSMGKVF
jgi:hypothetical protein